MTETIKELEERVTTVAQRLGLHPPVTQEFMEAVTRTVNSHRAHLGWPLVEPASTPEQLRTGVLKFKLKP